MLLKPNPVPPNFLIIPPAMYVRTDQVLTTNLIAGEAVVFTNNRPVFGNLVRKTAENLLLVGWVERVGTNNLYDTTLHDLIRYSKAHDTLFLSSGEKVILGAYSFTVPSAALNGQTYRIQLGRPSATADGVNVDVFIDTPTNGSLRAGRINGTKTVTVGSRHYIVGDVAPFRWLNAGDFGNATILNNDVVQVFQSALYTLNTPPFNSDLFDAMDSANGSSGIPAYLSDNVTAAQINAMQLGDGRLAVDDVFVTYHRALDPTLIWYERYWSNGVRQVVAVPNLFRPAPTNQPPPPPAEDGGSTHLTGAAPSVVFTAETAVGGSGQTVKIPIRATISGNMPLRNVELAG